MSDLITASDPLSNNVPASYASGPAGWALGALYDMLEEVGTAFEWRFKTDALTNAPSGSGLDAAGVRSAVGLASANLDTQITGLNTNIDAVDTEVAAVSTILTSTGVTVAGASKTGYSLASTGLDSISTTQPVAERPANFREWLMWLARRFGNKQKLDTGTLTVYADDGVTTLSVQPYAETTSTQTIDPLT